MESTTTSIEISEHGPSRSRYVIVLVEDSASLAHVYTEYLKYEPVDLVHFDAGEEALTYLETNLPDVILLDLKLPDIDGMEILRHVHQKQIPCPVVIITGHGSVDIAVESMGLGAADFLEKPFERERLIVTLRNVLKINRLTEIVEDLQEFRRNSFEGFIGGSVATQVVYKTIEAAASSAAPIFITGESGTGKEVCAEAVHRRSKRADKPFVAINCAAIPSELLESELFGHKKGAFTGAVSDRNGAAVQADGGTLFLDEIGELPLELQAKLLRFVQSGVVQKIGSDDVQTVDVRLVCATNRDPLTQVANREFREDLFYRLHVIPIKLPPLRERNDDVIQLAQRFLDRYSEEESKAFTTFSPAATDTIGRYGWPGNVRELQNVIRNIVVMNEGAEVSVEMLPAAIHATGAGRILAGPSEDPSGSAGQHSDSGLRRGTEIRPLWKVEQDAILEAIELCDGSIPRAAAFLEVSPSTLYRKLQSWKGA